MTIVTDPSQGVGFRVNRGPIMPNSFIEIPVPASPTIDSATTATAVPWLASEVASVKANVNTTAFSPQPYVALNATPRVPVAYVDMKGQILNPKSQKALVLSQTGVPIPSGYVSPPSTDAPATFYTPDFSIVNPSTGLTMVGMQWDVYALVPAGSAWDTYIANGHTHTGNYQDPRNLGFAWECQNAMRLLDLPNSPGHPLDRFPTADPVANPAQFACTEVSTWGTTATELPLLPLMMLVEDVALWQNSGETVVPPHALGIASVQHPSTFVWPALARDAYIGINNQSPVKEGIRLWMPRSVAMPGNLTSIGRMIFRQAQEYGFVIWDHSSDIAIRADPSVAQFFNGVNGVMQFANFPWSSLQVLAVGSDANAYPGTVPTPPPPPPAPLTRYRFFRTAGQRLRLTY